MTKQYKVLEQKDQNYKVQIYSLKKILRFFQGYQEIKLFNVIRNIFAPIIITI